MTADVTLLLEGTYPYVSGGVSSWMHQIINALPELTFSLVFLGSKRGDYGAEKYKLADHVVHLERHYLMEPLPAGKPRPCPGTEAHFSDARCLHDFLRQPAAGLPAGLLERFLQSFGEPGGITYEQFLYSQTAWQQICQTHRRFCGDQSFVEYFWTVRNMHAMIFKLAEVARHAPPSRVYHSISTGYAGLLGALLHYKTRRPLILTEHGIYTKERKIDLAQASWIRDPVDVYSGNNRAGYIRWLWIRFFHGLGRLTYAAADPIITLYEGNRQRQVLDGAEPARTRVVTNGIDLERFAGLRERRPGRVPRVLGLIGRIVPIKDIKTFIRAMRIVCNRVPDVEGWLVGPVDEDREYVRQCEELVAGLELHGKVKFLGFKKMEDILPQLGLMLLTSISEAMPLVLLEGFASGLPAVATDVGACREIIEGGGDEDRALGSAGAVVAIADPEATAQAALSLLTDEGRWRRAQEAGIRRVERFYTQKHMIDKYRDVYEQALRR